MAIVWPCPLPVDAYVAAGREVEVPRPVCPSCAGPLVFWSGYWRHVRAAGRCRKIFVPRLRCGPCRVSHALLPAFTLAWRLDVAETVGAVIAQVAGGGCGVRPAAARAGVPYTTARGWVRRFRARAPELGTGFDEFRAGITAVKRQDPLVFTAGLTYQTTLPNKSVTPGDQVTPAVGLLLAISPETSLKFAQQLSFVSQTSVRGRNLPGSGLTSGIFSFELLSILGRGLVLDFTTGDILAARLYHVLLSIDDRDVALRVHGREVAGVEPVALERGRGACVIVEIADHQMRRPVNDLTDHAGRHVAHDVVDDPGFDIQDGASA